MNCYYLKIGGMGLESGSVCIPCVFAFLKAAEKQKGVLSVRFLSMEKEFMLASSETKPEKIKKQMTKASKEAGLNFGKEFSLISFRVCH